MDSVENISIVLSKHRGANLGISIDNLVRLHRFIFRINWSVISGGKLNSDMMIMSGILGTPLFDDTANNGYQAGRFGSPSCKKKLAYKTNFCSEIPIF